MDGIVGIFTFILFILAAIAKLSEDDTKKKRPTKLWFSPDSDELHSKEWHAQQTAKYTAIRDKEIAENNALEAQREAARKEREDGRLNAIRERSAEWGEKKCNLIIEKQIAVTMTYEMVLLAWGKPSTIDQQDITAKRLKERWIYGTPRHGANYVWFADGRVTKIKT